MKRTWKKVTGLMLAVMTTFIVTACGKEETSTFQRITDDMIQNCTQVSQGAVQSLASFDAETLEQMKGNRDDFTRTAAEEWSEETAIMGAFKEMGEPSTDVDREENVVRVTIPAEFEKQSGVLTFVFNYNKDYDQMIPAYMTVAEVESFSSNMKGAAINTVMGVGTVFVVLIFLIMIISLFKYVNKIGQKEEKPAAPAPKAAPAPAPVQAPAEEDLTDDLELVAVISAAIAASENTSTDSFVVRSIKKVNRSTWRRA